jgi:hypothetical protein
VLVAGEGSAQAECPTPETRSNKVNRSVIP